MRHRIRLLGVAPVLLAGSAAWADIPPRPPVPPASQPATEPTTKPAPAPKAPKQGKAGGAVLGLAMTALLLGSGLYLVRRRQH